jgi:hypothetical protein
MILSRSNDTSRHEPPDDGRAANTTVEGTGIKPTRAGVVPCHGRVNGPADGETVTGKSYAMNIANNDLNDDSSAVLTSDTLTSRRVHRAIRLSESRAAAPRSAAYQGYPLALWSATADRSFHLARPVADPCEIYDAGHPFHAVLRLVSLHRYGLSCFWVRYSHFCCRWAFDTPLAKRRTTANEGCACLRNRATGRRRHHA